MTNTATATTISEQKVITELNDSYNENVPWSNQITPFAQEPDCNTLKTPQTSQFISIRYNDIFAANANIPDPYEAYKQREEMTLSSLTSNQEKMQSNTEIGTKVAQKSMSGEESFEVDGEQLAYLTDLRREFYNMPTMLFYNLIRLWHVQQDLSNEKDWLP